MSKEDNGLDLGIDTKGTTGLLMTVYFSKTDRLLMRYISDEADFENTSRSDIIRLLVREGIKKRRTKRGLKTSFDEHLLFPSQKRRRGRKPLKITYARPIYKPRHKQPSSNSQ